MLAWLSQDSNLGKRGMKQSSTFAFSPLQNQMYMLTLDWDRKMAYNQMLRSESMLKNKA